LLWSQKRAYHTKEMAEKELLTLKEVAALLGCKPAHARNLLNGAVPGVPRIPHGRAGRVRLIRRAAVLVWMQALERASTTVKDPPGS
jgi:Helix-turn-helix domain